MKQRISAYIKLVHDISQQFKCFTLTRIPRGENTSACALVALASSSDPTMWRMILAEGIDWPSIMLEDSVLNITLGEGEDGPEPEEYGPDWRTPIIEYLSTRKVPDNKWDESDKCPSYNHFQWVVICEVKGPYLRGIYERDIDVVIVEIHEGICENHSGGRTMSFWIKRHGYYWPTIIADCEDYLQKSDKCQRHVPHIH